MKSQNKSNKRDDIDQYIEAVSASVDFIANALDSDETGLYDEMIPQLYDLLDYLKRKNKQKEDRSIKYLVKKILKNRTDERRNELLP